MPVTSKYLYSIIFKSIFYEAFYRTSDLKINASRAVTYNPIPRIDKITRGSLVYSSVLYTKFKPPNLFVFKCKFFIFRWDICDVSTKVLHESSLFNYFFLTELAEILELQIFNSYFN